MVGRDDARRQLEGAAAAARRGEPALVLVSGEAGIGKSRLVSEAMGQGDAECVLMAGGGVDLSSGDIPLILLSSSVRSLVQRYGLDAVRGWAKGEASRLAILVRDLAPDAAVVCEPLELIESFRAMLARLSADRFVWWSIEDLQWADVASLDALRFVVQLMQAPERLLVTCTLRTGDRPLTAPAREFLSELVRAPATLQIRLRRLDPEQVRAQMAALYAGQVSGGLADRVMFLSDGVPFLVEELVAAGLTESGPLPGSATELMLSRLTAFGVGAEAVVRAASIAPDHVHDHTLAAVTGLSADVVEQALTTLTAGGVLEVDDTGEGYRFHHALMREGIVAAMLPGERRRWHGLWAQALSRAGADDRDASGKVEIARHWIESGEPDPAFVATVAAAQGAELVGSQGTRALMLVEALRLWPHVEAGVRAGHDQDTLLEQAIWACALGGRPELGIQMLTDPLNDSDASDEGELRRLRLTLAKERFEVDLGRQKRVDSGLVLDERVELLRRAPRTLVFAHAVSEMLANCTGAETARRLDDLVQDAIEVVAQKGNFFDRVDLHDSRSHHLKVLGRLGEAADLQLEILREYGPQLQLSDLLRVESNAISHLYDVCRFIECRAVGRRSLQRLSDPRLCAGPWTALAENVAATLIETGDWVDAQQYLERVDALELEIPSTAMAALSSAVLECRRGDLNAAEHRLVTLGESQGARVVGPQFDVCRTLVEAELALSGGDAPAAWAMLTPLWPMAEGQDLLLTRKAQFLAARALNAIAFGHGPPPRDHALDDRVRELGEAATQLPPTVWPAPLRERFELALASSLGEDTLDQWEHSVAESERLGQPYEQGLALVGLARRALVDGTTPVAQGALERARLIATGLGSRTLSAWIREAAVRGRISLDDDRDNPSISRTSHGLTEREFEVLRLLADGYSNDEIGAALYMSPKTASVHVSRILTKLGVKSRGAASAVAYREGLFEQR